jgi:hypothetical protein
VLEAVWAALKRRDLFMVPSERWGDPRAQLLTGQAWEAQRVPVCRTLGRAETPEPELARWAQELDAAYRLTAANLPGNAAVRIESAHGRDELVQRRRVGSRGRADIRVTLEQQHESHRSSPSNWA